MAKILVGCLEGSLLKVDLSGGVKKKIDFRFWITSDAQMVSLCLSSM